MNCPSEQELHLHHDGELAAGRDAEVATHVAECPECAARLNELKLIGDLIRSAPLPQPAADALRRWKRSVSTMQEQSVRRLASWMTAAASVVLVVSLYSAVARQSQAATISLADWEPAAIGIESDSSISDQATAQWIATDLSRSPANGSDR